MSELSVKEIQRVIEHRQFDRLICKNVFLLGSPFEADLISITSSGYYTEYEIKLSRQDFTADFRKKSFGVTKHEHLAGIEQNCRGWSSKPVPRPKHFYFVTPKDTVPLDAIPEHCGLIEIWPHDRGPYRKTIKQAPTLSKPTKLDFAQMFNLAMKLGRKADQK